MTKYRRGNMRSIWGEEDIDCGLWVIKNSSEKPLEDPSFAVTVIKKIGYVFVGKEQKYCTIDALTDGMVLVLGTDKKSVADMFNNCNYGYRKLSHKELRKILKAYGERYK